MDIKVLLINENGASFVEIENSNKAFNEALKWDDSWNCPNVKVRNHDYVVVCSDTGKIRHEKVSCLAYSNLIEPSATLKEPFIVESCIITKFDGVDDFESLNAEDIEILKSRLFTHGKTHMRDYYPTLLILD